MAEYSKANVKLSDIQIKQLETAVKIKTGTTLRTSLKLNYCWQQDKEKG